MHEFEFAERWVLPYDDADVGDVLADLAGYPSWWPQVLAVAALGPDDAQVLCRSTLPYTLDLGLHAVSRELPRLESAVSGDLVGYVAWQVSTDSSGATVVEFEQRVFVGKPWLARVVPVLGPMMEWNHRRMMTGCRHGLERRLRELAGA